MALKDILLDLAAPLIRRLGARRLAERRAQFALVPTQPGRAVFLGDSIVEQGQWDGWFPALPTLNRGVAGETIGQIGARLASALHRPVAVVLMAGTNDVHAARSDADIAQAAAAMESLIKAIRAAAPDAKLIVNSISPRAARYRERIIALNGAIKAIAAREGVTYLDLWPAMASPSGEILSELTTDGLHLTARGYAVWAAELAPLLNPCASGRPAGSPSR